MSDADSVNVPRNVLTHPLYLELTMQDAVYLEGLMKTYITKLKKDEQYNRLVCVLSRLSSMLYDVNSYIVVPF